MKLLMFYVAMASQYRCRRQRTMPVAQYRATTVILVD